ncbi:hypothetical protein DEO72_LG7g991 [Vigna unguiculata]|uniref:Uncharacterized protein n=1 Tax=Vigna unguiculata TaxID=3917 RepID=A0A4D6MFB0_VIGUN|nr:hypothetical protein DEO72_LG7g991 [Vigna unguiculata]
MQVYLVVVAAMVAAAMVDSDAVLFRSTGSFMVVRSSGAVFAQIWSAVCAAGVRSVFLASRLLLDSRSRLRGEDDGFGSGACCCNGSLRVQRLLVCTVKSTKMVAHRGARSVNGAVAAWCSGGRRGSDAVVVLAARRWRSKMVKNGGGCRGGSWWRLGFEEN